MSNWKHTWIIGLICMLALAVTACQTAPDTAVDEAAVVDSEEVASVSPTEEAPTEVPTDTAEPEQTETSEPEPTETSEPEPTETAVPPTEEAEEAEDAEPALRAVEASPFVVAGTDGLEIQGTLHSAPTDEKFPAVLLLHMLNSNQGAWGDLVPVLTDAGYVVLAIDMRGHGATGGNQDWELAEQDLSLVWEALVALEQVDEARTAVIGGSIGSNMALITAKNEPTVRTAVLLSPGLDYRGVQTEQPVVDYGERPLLIVASQEDGYSANSSQQLSELSANGTLEIYDGAGHGTNMLGNEAELAPLILEWLSEHLT